MRVSVTAIVVISDLVTLVLSLMSVVFVTGLAFGEVRSDITAIKHDIAQIQGMFVTRVRSDRVDKD